MDLIDRQDAIDIVAFECGEWQGLAKEINEQIQRLPSAKPEQKTGKWIEHEDWYDTYYECSACGEAFSLIEGTPKDNGYNYCPNCGCKMVGAEDE